MVKRRRPAPQPAEAKADDDETREMTHSMTLDRVPGPLADDLVQRIIEAAVTFRSNGFKLLRVYAHTNAFRQLSRDERLDEWPHVLILAPGGPLDEDLIPDNLAILIFRGTPFIPENTVRVSTTRIEWPGPE